MSILADAPCVGARIETCGWAWTQTGRPWMPLRKGHRAGYTISDPAGKVSGATNFYIITGYADIRKSIDGLCAIIMSQLQQGSCGNSIYLFYGKRCDRIKVLLRESDGYVLLYKRLDVIHGKYRWTRNRSEVSLLPGNNSTGLCQGSKSSSQRHSEQPEIIDYIGFFALWYNETIKNGRKNVHVQQKTSGLQSLRIPFQN